MTTDLKRTAEDANPELEGASAPPETKKQRLPKRKVALQIGYCGTGYHGMQLNPPHKTIEGDLFAAIAKAGGVSEDNASDPKKSSFLRAARTDKGVHAAGNVVSLKMIIEDPKLVEKINSYLPEQIRVWGYTRTNRSFECRKVCSSRVYEYVLPTYTLIPPSPFTILGKTIREKTNKLDNNDSVLNSETSKFWADVTAELAEAGVTMDTILEAREKADPEDEASNEVFKTLKNIENKHRRNYRACKERVEFFRDTLQAYQGVHNFHNFTVGKTFKDPSAMRVMKELTVSEPFLVNGTEWVSVKIHGQSFMLHQIRKMIALAVLIVRTMSNKDKIIKLYEHNKLPVPKAPALGLLLERPVYDAYNERLGRLGHEHIEFDKYETEIDAFKRKFIYDRIYTQEAQENEFQAFFGYMDTYRLHQLFDFLLDIKTENIADVKTADASEKPLEDESDNEANTAETEG